MRSVSYHQLCIIIYPYTHIFSLDLPYLVDWSDLTKNLFRWYLAYCLFLNNARYRLEKQLAQKDLTIQIYEPIQRRVLYQ